MCLKNSIHVRIKQIVFAISVWDRKYKVYKQLISIATSLNVTALFYRR